MLSKNVCTTSFNKIYRAAASLVMILGLTGLTLDNVQARQPKPRIDNTHCACVCHGAAPTGEVVEYPNPGTCGALNGKTCTVEVDQGGVTVVRTGTLWNCGPRVIF